MKKRVRERTKKKNNKTSTICWIVINQCNFISSLLCTPSPNHFDNIFIFVVLTISDVYFCCWCWFFSRCSLFLHIFIISERKKKYGYWFGFCHFFFGYSLFLFCIFIWIYFIIFYFVLFQCQTFIFLNNVFSCKWFPYTKYVRYLIIFFLSLILCSQFPLPVSDCLLFLLLLLLFFFCFTSHFYHCLLFPFFCCCYFWYIYSPSLNTFCTFFAILMPFFMLSSFCWMCSFL